jgi:transposase
MNGLNDAYVESVIKKAISGKLKTGQAAAKLGISKQYVNRLKKSYSEKGPSCFAHTKRQPPLKRKPPEPFRKERTSLLFFLRSLPHR